MPLPSVFHGVQDSRLPGFKPSKPSKRLQTLPQAFPRQQLLQLHASAICFSRGSRLPFARLQTLKTLKTLQTPPNPPNASAGLSKATTLTATCPCHLFFTGFKTAVCPNPQNPQNASKRFRKPFQGNNSYSYMPLPSVFHGVQDCRLPGFKPSKPSKPFQTLPQAFPRQQLLQLHAPAICFSRGSRQPFARLQTLKTLKTNQTLPQAFPRQQLLLLQLHAPAICFSRGSRLPFARLQTFKTLQTLQTLPQAFPRQQLLQLLHAPAICFSRGSRLPFARLQTLKTPPNTSARLSKATTLTATCPCQSVFHGVQDCRLPGFKPSKPLKTPPNASAGLSKATTLTATCPCHLFFTGFKTAVCPASNPQNASKRFRRPFKGNNSYSYMPLPSVFHGVQDCRLPGFKPSKPSKHLKTAPNASAGLSNATTLTATCPCHLFFRGFKTAVCPASNPPNAPASVSKATTLTHTYHSDMPLPSHLSRGSRLPFARLQTLKTLQTPPNASAGLSKATTLTATCPCHLFFTGFKTAVCPASNPQNPQNASKRFRRPFQGNNSYSYMPLPSVFHGVQDCRLPGFKPSKPLKTLQTLPQAFPRQQLLQLHAPAICFSGGSRLPFARPQTPQTLPQASKATTVAATCPFSLSLFLSLSLSLSLPLSLGPPK